MNLNDTKSPETLRKEISQDLDRLDNKVDSLKNRLTPGQVLDDAIFSRYRGNPRETFNYLRSNPVGTSFLALGAFLLMDNEGQSYEHYLRSQGGQVYRDYKGKVTQVTGEIGGKIEQVKGDVRNRTQSLVDRGEKTIQKMRNKGEQLKEQVGLEAEHIKQKVSSRTESIKKQVGSQAEEIREQFSGAFSEGETSEVGSNVIDATESFKERSMRSIKTSIDSEEVNSRLSKVKDSVRDFSRSTVDKIKEKEIDSLGYVALGGTVGFITGGLIPFSEDELSSVSSEFDFSGLRTELEQAANESINIFKNEFIDTIKNSSVDIF